MCYRLIFFSIYIDSVVEKVITSNLDCYIKLMCMSILLYADDILLIAPSVTCYISPAVNDICELEWLDMSLNARKSTCSHPSQYKPGST